MRTCLDSRPTCPQHTSFTCALLKQENPPDTCQIQYKNKLLSENYVHTYKHVFCLETNGKMMENMNTRPWQQLVKIKKNVYKKWEYDELNFFFIQERECLIKNKGNDDEKDRNT